MIRRVCVFRPSRMALTIGPENNIGRSFISFHPRIHLGYWPNIEVERVGLYPSLYLFLSEFLCFSFCGEFVGVAELEERSPFVCTNRQRDKRPRTESKSPTLVNGVTIRYVQCPQSAIRQHTTDQIDDDYYCWGHSLFQGNLFAAGVGICSFG